MPTYTGTDAKDIHDQQRQQICARKRQYWSQTDALQQADRIHKDLRAYRCPFCQNWHLTHKRRT